MNGCHPDSPQNCIYCKSYNITPGKISVDDIQTASQDVSCDDCGKRWYELYKFWKVEEE